MTGTETPLALLAAWMAIGVTLARRDERLNWTEAILVGSLASFMGLVVLAIIFAAIEGFGAQLPNAQ